MTTALADPLAPALLAHLDRQLESARRLLAAVLQQGAAARGRDVDTVLRTTSEIQLETERRGALETERTILLTHAAERCGCAPAEVTLERLQSLMPPAEAALATGKSGELRGLLEEIRREHLLARAVMRQELQFLDHLTRRLNGDAEGGAYRPGGSLEPHSSHATSLSALDLQA